ncbi:hypothetical protein A2U01_0067088, partial [Trifolium medium]|nr:hypothetical protein [Trifolium medium]
MLRGAPALDSCACTFLCSALRAGLVCTARRDVVVPVCSSVTGAARR